MAVQESGGSGSPIAATDLLPPAMAASLTANATEEQIHNALKGLIKWAGSNPDRVYVALLAIRDRLRAKEGRVRSVLTGKEVDISGFLRQLTGRGDVEEAVEAAEGGLRGESSSWAAAQGGSASFDTVHRDYYDSLGGGALEATMAQAAIPTLPSFTTASGTVTTLAPGEVVPAGVIFSMTEPNGTVTTFVPGMRIPTTIPPGAQWVPQDQNLSPQYDSGIAAAQRTSTTPNSPSPGANDGTGVAPSPGAASGTGSGSTGMDAGSAGTTSGTTTSPVQVPGGGELWRVDNGYWLIYTVPGTTPPVPMAWRVGDPARIGNPPVVKTMTTQEFQEAGALDFGSISEINNTSAHPFESFLNEYETEAGVKPWLWDPEIMALNAMAVLEGRAVTEAELQQTEWWQTHSKEEREWLEHVSRDPRTAAREVEDAINGLRGELIRMGVEGTPESAIRYIVTQSLTGKWTGAYTAQQINKLADPYVAVDMDAGLQEALAGVELNTLADNVETVRTEVAKWLGPAFAKGWTESQLRDWAGRVRNNDTALEELRTTLRQQRLALFPEYANPDLSYQDIAAPWREVWAQSWGQQADEYDPLFNRIIRTNDLGEASKMLRREGLNRGVGAVVDQALIGIQSAFGGQVRNPL